MTMPARNESVDHAVDGGNAVLNRLRNMWQFANLCQWIYIFGKAVKLDDSIDIEEIENQSLKPDSTLLSEIALAILRVVSNHRGLTLDGVDSQAQKQYLAHAPDRNPFGSDEITTRFEDLDIFTKIIVLQQFTQWAMIHPERLREKMEEQKDTDQATWRIEPYGWDSKDRTYFVLDDNRVYRLTEAPPTSQNQSKKKKKNLQQYGRRSSKRRRTERGIQEVGTVETEFNDDMADEGVQEGLGGMKWECIAISLEQVRDLIQDFRNHRDPNEKILQQQLEVHLIPILEKQEESRKRRALQRDRDLANLAKMANAKRSSRIANKVEQQKQEDKLKEEEKNARIAEQARIKEERARLRQEQQREVRMASRETRLKEREARRKLYTEELAQLSAEDSKRGDAASGRASERRIQAEIEKNKQALEALDDEDEDWVFDCICGLFGQVDDGTHSVACETCNVWQHSKCLGISEEEAERPEFHFLCKSCRNRQDPDTRQRPLIKLKVNRQTETESQAPETNGAGADESVSRVGSAPGPAGLSSASGSTTTNRPEQPSITHAVGVEASLTQTPIRASIKPVTIDRANGNQAKEDTLSPSTSSSAQPKSISEGLAPVAPKTSTPLTRPFHEHKLLPGPASNTPEGGHGLFPPITGEGNTPSQAGISPVKPPSHDAPTPVSSKVAGITSSNITSAGTPISPNTMRLPPGVTLAPSPQQPILTPPIKHPEPVRAPIDNKSQHWNDGQPTYQPTN